MSWRPGQVYAILWTHGERTPWEAIEWWNNLTELERTHCFNMSRLLCARERYRQLVKKFPNRTVYENLTISSKHQ